MKNLEELLLKDDPRMEIEQVYESIFEDVNGALKYINEKAMRFRFVENLADSYEAMLKELQEQHENLLFQHFLEVQPVGNGLALDLS